MAKQAAGSGKLALRIVLTVGVLLAIIGVCQGFARLAIVNWPAAQARVMACRVASDDTGSPTRYFAETELRYTVSGTDYTSKTVPGGGTYPAARRLADRYRVGTEHPVRYRPSDPREIYANAGYTLDFFLTPLILTGLGLAIAAVSLMVMVPGRPAKQRDSKHGLKLLGCVFLLAGAACLLMGARFGYLTHVMLTTWPAIGAQVATNRIHRYAVRGDANRPDAEHFEVIVEFRYSAGGRQYLSPSSKDFTSSKEALAAVAAVAPGSLQQVRYNPADPNEIAFGVDSEVWLGCYIFLGVGAGLALLGAVFVLLPRRKPAAPTGRKVAGKPLRKPRGSTA